MFACLCGNSEHLYALASEFSPLIEVAAADTVVFSIAGLNRLIGTQSQIASEISRRGEEAGIQASIGIAANPDTAILAARNMRGITIIPEGRELDILGDLPVEVLPAQDSSLLETLNSWGIVTLADFAALPELGIRERLGEEGADLLSLASGRRNRPLHITRLSDDFSSREDLDYPLTKLEPLLFILSRQLHHLTARMTQQSLAAQRMTLVLDLENRPQAIRSYEFPFPSRDAKALLRQAQLDLERKPAGGAILAVTIQLDAVAQRVRQGGLFLPGTPEPEQLQTLVSRLGALVGPQQVGSPEMLNTHRPDAWKLRAGALDVMVEPKAEQEIARPLVLAFRYFRPAIQARVETRDGVPWRIEAPNIRGDVAIASGPWRTSGEWWTSTSWSRDEWDLALRKESTIVRVYRTIQGGWWFLEGSYD